MKNLIRKIITPRVVVRMLEFQDAKDLQRLLAKNKEFMLPWIPWAVDEPETVEAKKDKIRTWRGEFYLDQKYTYGLFKRDDQTLIGMIFLFARQGKGILEIGYIIDADEVRNGYATESSYAVTKLGLQHLQVEKMVIHCSPENIGSQRIPEKLGFILEGTDRSTGRGPHHQRQQTMIWALFQEEFRPAVKYEPIDFQMEPGWDELRDN